MSASSKRKKPETAFRCQFCGVKSPVKEWVDGMTCPKCGLMHQEDDGCGVGWGN